MSRKKSTPSNESNKLTLVIAVIGLIGTAITAYLSFRSSSRSTEIIINATQAAEARLTENANFAKMTQSAISPSLTWTPSPAGTETPTPTLTATPDISSTLLLQDDFIDNRNGWLVQDETMGLEAKIIGGKYILSIFCPPEHFVSHCARYIEVPGLTSRTRDLQFELDATVKNILSGTDLVIAFQFRKVSDNHYEVYFRSTGKYAVEIDYKDTQAKLLEETSIPSFSKNTDTVNRYGFSVINTLITPLFNGHELLSVEDGNINQGGLVDIAIFISKGGSAVIELDNVVATDKIK